MRANTRRGIGRLGYVALEFWILLCALVLLSTNLHVNSWPRMLSLFAAPVVFVFIVWKTIVWASAGFDRK